MTWTSSSSDSVATKLFTARTLAEAGIFKPDAARPAGARRSRRCARGARRPRPATRVGRPRYPDEPAIIDELGHADLRARSTSARTRSPTRWQADGIGEGDGVAILCRNHRGFVESTSRCSKLGADALYLNTSFAGPQIAEVCEREEPKAHHLRRRSSTELSTSGARPQALRRLARRRATAPTTRRSRT